MTPPHRASSTEQVVLTEPVLTGPADPANPKVHRGIPGEAAILTGDNKQRERRVHEGPSLFLQADHLVSILIL
jgi:hypothetical protein